MEPSSAELAEAFCALCNWAYVCWKMHKALFDDNPRKELLDLVAPYFHRHIRRISQDYSILQICKLHDRDYSKATNSLSIRYIIDKLDDWGDEKDILEQLAKRLDELNQRINPARNKIIAHNDLEILLKGDPIGAFSEGLDVEYFQLLQEFVNRVSQKWIHRIYPFSSGAENNANEYLVFLENSDLAKRRLDSRTFRSHRNQR